MSEWLELRVRQITYEAADINSYELVDPAARELPPFEAGAHLDVAIPGGPVRQYSLCNAPWQRRRYLIAVLNERGGRGGSRRFHEAVRAGDLLRVSAPRNNFRLDERARHHLLLAGGIGITPLLAMVARLEALAAPFALHYCARSPEQAAFLGVLRPLAAAGQVHYHFDGGEPSRGLDVVPLLAAHAEGAHLYCCGPERLMAAVRAASAGWPRDAVHFEYFAPPAAEAAEARAAEGFTVRIASTGALLPVPPERSILEVLRAHGLTVESSCEVGTCGTCRTRYLDGEPDHRDWVLTEEEQKQYLMTCVSRSKTPLLTLDL